jgi:hypothetical protein
MNTELIIGNIASAIIFAAALTHGVERLRNAATGSGWNT